MKKFCKKERDEFIEDCKRGTIKERDLAKKYGISKGSVFRMRKTIKNISDKSNSDENLKIVNKQRSIQYYDLDAQIFEVFSYLRQKNIPINGTILKTIGLKMALKMEYRDFKASNGWLDGFKKRHELSFKNISGEEKSADFSSLD
ncbi:Tigger transposable element-derived protein 6, partial [Dictyocoela muelleri]